MAGPTHLRRDAGVIGLLYASLGSIIGSGWLFGALHAALQAGPLSVISWIIGAGAILLLAFVFAELSTMYPNSGALVHMTHVSHGSLVGKIWSWILFLAFVSVPPVECSAVLTYTNSWIPGLIHTDTGLLTDKGFVWAAVMMAVVVALNFLAVRWVIWINSAATWWKLLIPVVTVGILMFYSFHPENMTTEVSSVPISGIFTAVGTAGIIFSYLGFQQAIALAGETTNPGKYVPIALVGSVLIGAVVYIGLQLAFIVALQPADMAGGWTNLHFSGMFGPLAAIAVAVGAFWWAVVLYADAVVSPLGTAFIYVTASPRIIMAAGEMGNAPSHVIQLNRHGVPWVGLVVTYLVGVLFFFPFPSWQELVAAVSSIAVMSYAIGPVILLHLRSALPEAERPFRLKGAWLVSNLAFIVSNWIIYWTGYNTVRWLLGLIAVYVLLYHIWYLFVARAPFSKIGWQYSWWLIPYFVGLWAVCYFGPSGSMGGTGAYDFFTGMWIISAFSIVILWLSQLCGHNTEQAESVHAHVETLGSRGEMVVRTAEETAP